MMSRAIRNRFFPIGILILINIMIGCLLATDYGESWDEQSLRTYTDLSINAYQKKVAGVSMGDYYGDNILKYYGPAYLMAARLVISPFTTNVLHEVVTSWHFVNFISFQICLIFFYLICKRYLSTPAALGCTFLFNTQPLLWGHAFINPKDIPFMALFSGTILTGFYLGDAMTTSKTSSSTRSVRWRNYLTLDWNNAHCHERSSILKHFAILLVLTIVVLAHLADPPASAFIHAAYHADRVSLLGNVFAQFARGAQQISVDAYIHKGVTLLNVVLWIMAAITGISFIVKIVRIFRLTCKNYLHPGLVYLAATLRCWQFWAAVLMLGLSTSIRTLGPLAGLLVSIFLLYRNRWKALPILILYFFAASLVSYLTWPYLWDDPFQRFFESFSVMARFPFGADVLFNGHYYPPDALPATFLPLLITIQITETALVLSLIGLAIVLIKIFKDRASRMELLILLSWFFLPFLAVIMVKPAMYDNFRQFFFIIPPLFILSGFALQAISSRVRPFVLVLIMMAMIAPGVYQIITLHPYQYVYYNSLAGGTGKAYRRFELDYWATSFREVTKELNTIAPPNARVIVSEPLHLVKDYARPDLVVELYPSGDTAPPTHFDFAITTTRLEKDQYVYPGAPVLYQAGRQGAIFALLRDLRNKK